VAFDRGSSYGRGAGATPGRAWAIDALAILAASACAPTIVANPGAGAGSASQVVDATGATITTDDGTILVIPPGAVTQPVTITIGLSSSPVPLTQATAVTAAHVFGPAQTFSAQVCITLAFEPELLPDGLTAQDVVLFAAATGSGNYQPLPTSVIDASHVMGTTNQFSATIFAAYNGAAHADADGGATCDASDGGEGG
jgi:hypothetical protein